jgi:hypothetical protein
MIVLIASLGADIFVRIKAYRKMAEINTQKAAAAAQVQQFNALLTRTRQLTDETTRLMEGAIIKSPDESTLRRDRFEKYLKSLEEAKEQRASTKGNIIPL